METPWADLIEAVAEALYDAYLRRDTSRDGIDEDTFLPLARAAIRKIQELRLTVVSDA